MAPSHTIDCLIDTLHTCIANKKHTGLLIIRISGYTALGKSTLTHKLASTFKEASIIEADSFMLNRIERHNQHNISGDNPRAIDFEAMQKAIHQLEIGRTIHLLRYNHNTGIHDTPETVYPSQLLFLDGTSVLYPQLHLSNEHISIFLDASDITRIQLLQEICVKERGYSKNDFQNELPKQLIANQMYIEPSKRRADYVITVDTHRQYTTPLISHCTCAIQAPT